MKIAYIFLLLVLNSVIFSQVNFVKQITSGDFDARNPFIFKDEYAYSNNYLFFEIHKQNSSNIYYKIYNTNTSQFEDTVALTNNNFRNINASYHPLAGMLYQTNQNGNWDIALIPDSNSNWGGTRFLTPNTEDEINPKYFEITDDHFWSFGDSANILFNRNGSVVHLNYKNGQTSEEVVFQSNSNFIYNQYTGVEDNSWQGSEGFFVFALEEESTGIKRIVKKFKPYGGSYEEKVILKESCDCNELEVQYSNFMNWGLFYSDTLDHNRRYFVIEDPLVGNPQVFNLPISYSGDLSSFEVYMFFIVTRNQNLLEPDLYWPHTYFLKNDAKTYVRFDKSDMGYWDEDSLHQLTVSDPSLAIGSLGVENFSNLVYTVWEDSINGHIHLFGTTQHLQFGSVNENASASEFTLYQNYPNPFNPSTKIDYKLLSASNVRFNVFNLLGEKVFDQNFGYQVAGSYKIDFDGKNLPSGVYVYSIYTDQNRLSRKMVLMK